MRLKDKVAIVTGAASGFGAEIARQYVAQGARVAVADINAAGAQAVAGELGGNAIAVTCDVAKRADIDALVKAAAFGGTTTVMDFVVLEDKGFQYSVDLWLKKAEKAAIDYSFHMNLTRFA